MFYSDGIIESRGHDLSEGTDRMLGAAAEAMVRPARPSPSSVVGSARSGEADDRAVFVIRPPLTLLASLGVVLDPLDPRPHRPPRACAPSPPAGAPHR